VFGVVYVCGTVLLRGLFSGITMMILKKVMREMDPEMFGNIEAKATFTGNLKNGIKDGIRDEW
jgi:hypothetical protein